MTGEGVYCGQVNAPAILVAGVRAAAVQVVAGKHTMLPAGYLDRDPFVRTGIADEIVGSLFARMGDDVTACTAVECGNK